MEIDKDKIDDAILALLYLTLGRDGRARQLSCRKSCRGCVRHLRQ